MKEAILKIEHLNIGFSSKDEVNMVVKDVSLCLNKNEILGVVGESGSGKSVTSLAILGLLPKLARVDGEILFEGKDISRCTAKEFRKIRGRKISMIFQEPMSSLNPSLTCGYQVLEIILEHQKISKRNAKKEVISLFEKVKLPRPEVLYNQYPHQLSGGQKQRVMIALAIACKPQVLIADEPTTALDVTVQKEIIGLLKEIQSATEMSIIFITHDLSLVSEIANSIIVMYKGTIVEQGNPVEIFNNAQHSYTKALIQARPKLDQRLKKLPTVEDFLQNKESNEIISAKERASFHKKLYSKPPLLEVVNLQTYFKVSGSHFFGDDQLIKAVDGVSFKLYRGEALGLVGESGCGKTTLGRTILQLEKSTSGTIFYQGADITKLSKSSLKDMRREIQIIFQDPYSSLNPRIPVGMAIMEPMKVHGILGSNAERRRYVLELLERVGLEEAHFNRYPHEFSGGQRQRIGIARTIVLKPKLIICDESVSALDVSVQAQVLNLLNELKDDFGFSYIFISHDLAVVKHMSDQLLVMNQGKIEESGDADEVYRSPQKGYTQRLIDAIPKGI